MLSESMIALSVEKRRCVALCDSVSVERNDLEGIFSGKIKITGPDQF